MKVHQTWALWGEDGRQLDQWESLSVVEVYFHRGSGGGRGTGRCGPPTFAQRIRMSHHFILVLETGEEVAAPVGDRMWQRGSTVFRLDNGEEVEVVQQITTNPRSTFEKPRSMVRVTESAKGRSVELWHQPLFREGPEGFNPEKPIFRIQRRERASSG